MDGDRPQATPNFNDHRELATNDGIFRSAAVLQAAEGLLLKSLAKAFGEAKPLGFSFTSAANHDC